MHNVRMLSLLAALAGSLLLSLPAMAAVGDKVVTLGADVTAAERTELTQLFGVDASANVTMVTTEDVRGALVDSGLPVAPTDKSISSSALTCLHKGEGLSVKTQNITRVTAPLYAAAMVTAGVGDGSVLIAAPAARPVSGETALVGVLQAFPQCASGKVLDPKRVRLAYEQVARTVALAGPSGDLSKASAVLLGAEQPVMTGQAKSDTAIGASLDAAASAQGIQISPAQRIDLVPFLKKFAGLDFGAYAKGYRVQQVSASGVSVAPAAAARAGSGSIGSKLGSLLSRVLHVVLPLLIVVLLLVLLWAIVKRLRGGFSLRPKRHRHV